MFKPNYRLMAEEGEGGPTGGQPPADPPATEPPANTQNFTPDWRESITDEVLRQYVDGKQFKDPGEAVKALQEMEGKYAVPASVDDYKLPVPDGEGGEFAKQAAGWMHEAGIPVSAGQALAAKWNEFQASQAQAAQVAQQQKAEQEIGALRGEWGAQFDANVELGRRAMQTFGVPAEVIDKMAGQAGDAQVIRIFQAIGKSMSESTLNPGDATSSGAPSVNQEAARAARMFPSMRKPS